MTGIMPPANPIRSLVEVTKSLREQEVKISEIPLAETKLFNPTVFKKGDPGQMAQDLKRLNHKIYFNGIPLTEIIKQEKINFVTRRLNDFVGVAENKAEREAAVQAIYKFYSNLSGRAGPVDLPEFLEFYNEQKDTFNKLSGYPLYLTLSGKKGPQDFNDLAPAELTEFFEFYDKNENLFTTILNKNPASSWLYQVNKNIQNGLENFFDRQVDINEFWRDLIRRHLLTNAGPKQEQQALLSFMELYAHQGGVFYAPYTKIFNTFAAIDSFNGVHSSPFNNMANSTIEFNFTDNHQLEIRETSEIVKMGSGQDDEGNLRFQYQAYGHNLMDYEVVSVVSHNPEAPDKFDLTLKEAESKIYSYDDNFWQALKAGTPQAERFEAMKMRLTAYADAYFLHDHNAEEANKILREFPEITQYQPVKPITFLRAQINPHEAEHNKFNSIFTVLNKVNPNYALMIASYFDVFVRNGLKSFTLGMKLLYRLGHKHEVARLLEPYNHDNIDVDTLVKQKTLENIYATVLTESTEKRKQSVEEKKERDEKTNAEKAAKAANKFNYPAASIDLPPITPVRNPAQIASRLAAEHKIEEAVVDRGIAGSLVVPETYATAQIRQITRDLIATQGRTYLNGRSLKEIIEEVRLDNFKTVFADYLSSNDAVKQQALQDFYDIYHTLDGKPKATISDCSPEKLADMVQYYRENNKIFETILEKNTNAGLNGLLRDLKNVEFTNYTNPKSHDITRRIFHDYFLNHLESEDEKTGVLNCLLKYNHQGGYNFAAHTMITEILTKIYKILGTQNITDHHCMDIATFEYRAIPHGLEVKEVTPETAIGDIDNPAKIKMSIPEANLIEFETVQTITYDAESEQKFQLKVQSAKAHVFEPSAWNFIADQLEQVNRFQEMRGDLIAYAKNYLQKGHDKSKAESIMKTYPELREHKSVKEIGTVTTLFNFYTSAADHNKYDSTLAFMGKLERGLKGLGKLDQTFAEGIRDNLKDYVSDEGKFVYAMKLLVRLGERDMVLDILSPQNKSDYYSDESLLTSAVFKELYPGVKNTVNASEPSRPNFPA